MEQLHIKAFVGGYVMEQSFEELWEYYVRALNYAPLPQS